MYDIFYVSKTTGNEQDWITIKSKYPLAQRLSNVQAYNDIKSKSFTKMFWVIWDDLNLQDDFDLINYKTTKWDNQYIHIFKNGEHYDGICLFPKDIPVSGREFHHRFFTAKKEIDILASKPKRYNLYRPQTYQEYVSITDELYWIVWPEVEIIDNTVFDLYFNHHNSYDRRENHVFKNLCNDIDSYVNGIFLCSKYKQISKKEFDRRYLVDKKEHNRTASKHKVYDVVFISYNEINADENYNALVKICPRAKRIHGITGIHQAHIEAAKLCSSDMFWVVDGDAIVNNFFNFNLVMSNYDIDCVHVWRSRNPINDLEYGNGGIKLLPRQLTLGMDTDSSDMTTSISKKFKAMNDVSNINSFNTDEFATWRSAFRECCKLASRIIERQQEEETQLRLDTWCTVGSDRVFGTYAIDGAKLGREYGTINKHNITQLKKINDFEWLKEQFNERYSKN